ncbi:MAG TPA: DNA repair protein RecN [Candidatus Marinimicrobia bacterium]|nr:DNA repair protein RecN [Candidatus Neomarinimicrobiota bacterium]
MGLKRLQIQNFAIIEQLAVDFFRGFSVITGETGAGKSIIIDALNLALGEKANPNMIRAGAESAVIECEFDELGSDHPALQFIRENGIPISGEVVSFRRELNINGRSKAWINQMQCPINVLKSAGDLLVDLHGQHDHQSLLKEENHLEFLDAFGDYQALKKGVRDAYLEVSHRIDRHSVLTERRNLNREKRELWEFQLKEIEKVNPGEVEDVQLINEKKLLDNVEKLHRLSEELSNALYEADENTLYQQILEINHKLALLNEIDAKFSAELARFEEFKFMIQELSNRLSVYMQEIQFDPGRIEYVNQRLYQIQQLRKKYGSSIAEILEYRQKIEKSLAENDHLDHDILKIEKELEDSKKRYTELAGQLSEKRKQAAQIFEREIVAALTRLGISGSHFSVQIKTAVAENGWIQIDNQPVRCESQGIDKVLFLISTNPGEPLRSLIEIVSGGEVSRIMLALKTIMAGKDRIPVVIFDEIDTGISGKVAQIVGRQLKSLAEIHQVICITHLPQIAGLGKHHYRVYKQSEDGRSQTNIQLLSHEERIGEIAALIGGASVTETTRRQALELLTE